jgi:SAM-dependent methyltransferase
MLSDKQKIAQCDEKHGESETPGPCKCLICGYRTTSRNPEDFGRVRGNTARFCNTYFRLWRCPRCLAIHSLDPIDAEDMYADYPLNKRQMDIYAKGTMGNLLRRLALNGLGKEDVVLDFGCGNGLLIEFLKRKGFRNAVGFDPYVPGFENLHPPRDGFDCVIANDVIEHADDPRDLMKECCELVRPGGMLYVGTADSEGVEDMKNLEHHVMRLHQPFHRVIITEEALQSLGVEYGLSVVQTWRRSYMDTLLPFANYRFLDEFSRSLGHNMDLMLDPSAGMVMLRKPQLLFYAFFGYFFPSAYEPAVLWKKPK